MADPIRFSSLDEALAALGPRATEVPLRPFLRGTQGVLLTLAALDADGKTTWYGIWVSETAVQPLGPVAPTSLLSTAKKLTGVTAALVDIVQVAARSYVDRLEELGSRIDRLSAQAEPGPLSQLAALQRDLATARRHVVRLDALTTDLEGETGTRFPGLDEALPDLQREGAQLETIAGGLSQAARDLVAIRNAIEANRLAEAANQLGRVSNRIATLANTSNLRMLGVAYVALVLALVSAVVLIPNTGATILGMPSAAWVPGVWVDVILLVLALVPIVVVFSRPWVVRMLRGFPVDESRSAEGLTDLPEVSPKSLERPGGPERLIR